MSILKGSINSKFGLKGEKPELRAGAFNNSQLHVQGNTTFTVKSESSKLDLDGKKPSQTYNSNLPK